MMIIGFLLTVSLRTFAAPICPPNRTQLKGLSEVSKYFDQINIIGNPDRKSAKDFAKDNHSTTTEIEKRYAASGDLLCGDRFAQAQLVVSNDLIITPAHSLFHGDCSSPIQAENCKFAVMENGKRRFYDLTSEVRAGYACPNSSKLKNSQDWAVLRLKKAVDSSIKPYDIGDPPCSSPSKPSDVVRVAKSDDWGVKPGQAMILAPRHYGNCQVQEFNCKDAKLLFSDCDTSGGSSGGGTFTRGEHPKLIGMASGTPEACPGDAKKLTGDYKHDCWSSIDIALTADFKREILKAAESSQQR